MWIRLRRKERSEKRGKGGNKGLCFQIYIKLCHIMINIKKENKRLKISSIITKDDLFDVVKRICIY